MRPCAATMRRDGFGDRGDVAHVQPLRVNGQAARLRLGGEVGGVSVRAYGRHDDGSGLGEQDGQLAPDSLRCAGDDDDATAEIEALCGGRRAHPALPSRAVGDRPSGDRRRRTERTQIVTIRHGTCPFLDDKNTSPEQSGAWLRRSALRDELSDSFEVRVGARELTHDATAREHDDLVSHRHRLLQIVHDQDDGLASVARAPDLIEHLLGLADGERGGRLVEDQAARAVDDGARDRDGLLLTARQGRGRVARAAVADRRRARPARQW